MSKPRCAVQILYLQNIVDTEVLYQYVINQLYDKITRKKATNQFILGQKTKVQRENTNREWESLSFFGG